MIEPEKQQFFVELLKALSVRKPVTLTSDQMATWWRALKDYPLQKVLEALDRHVKHSRFQPTPADLVRRITGVDERTGDAKESQASRDSRCVYEQNGARCPAVTSSFTFGNRGYCLEHGKHQHDPAHMQRILDEYLLHGAPFVPSTPHRQRAEYLFALGGPALVLAGKPCNDGTTWGPYDQAMVDWLVAQERDGGIRAFSYRPPSTSPRSVADLARRAIQTVEPEYTA